MRVDVDEPGGHQSAVGVELLTTTTQPGADLDYHAVTDRHVGVGGRSSRPVDDQTTADHQIEHVVTPVSVGRTLLPGRVPRPLVAGSGPVGPGATAGQAFFGSSENGSDLSLLGSRGNPSTRSPMMFFWIWSVPP